MYTDRFPKGVDLVNDVVVKQKTRHDILETGGNVGCNADNAKGRSRGPARNKVDCHQATKEGDETSDCNAEEYHCKYVDPFCRATEKEEGKCDGLQDSGSERRIFPVTLEYLVAEPSGNHRAEDTQNRIDSDDG